MQNRPGIGKLLRNGKAALGTSQSPLRDLSCSPLPHPLNTSAFPCSLCTPLASTYISSPEGANQRVLHGSAGRSLVDTPLQGLLARCQSPVQPWSPWLGRAGRLSFLGKSYGKGCLGLEGSLAQQTQTQLVHSSYLMTNIHPSTDLKQGMRDSQTVFSSLLVTLCLFCVYISISRRFGRRKGKFKYVAISNQLSAF